MEKDVFELFELAGFEPKANQIKYVSGDKYEIDILVKYKNATIIVECKQFEKSGSNIRNIIHQWESKNRRLKADRVLLVTYGVDISREHVELAKSYGISIWDENKFLHFLKRARDEKEKLLPEILRDLGLTADGIDVPPKSEAQIESELLKQQKKEKFELVKQYKREWALDYSDLIMAYEASEGNQEILVFINNFMEAELELFPKVVKEEILAEAGTQPESITYNSSIHLPIIEEKLKELIDVGLLQKIKDEKDDAYLLNLAKYSLRVCWPHTLMFVDIDVGKEEIELAKRKKLRCIVCRDLKSGITKNQKGLIILTKSDLMEHKKSVLTKFGAGAITEPEKKTFGTGLVAVVLLVLFAFLLFSSGNKSNQATQQGDRASQLGGKQDLTALQLSENQNTVPPTVQQLIASAMLNNNISFCGTLSQSGKEQCIIRFAGASSNFNDSLCETISNDAKIECYTASAKARSNSDICLKLASDADIKTCYWDFVNSRNCSTETKCFDGDGVKNCLECKLEVANLSRKDLIELEDCTSASSNDCYIKDRRIAIYLGEPKGCFNGVDCHTLMAQKHNIPLKKCDSVGADYVYCYMGVAYATTNFSICSQLPTDEYRNKCEYNIVSDSLHLKLIHNLSVCSGASERGTISGTGIPFRYMCAQQAAIYNGDNFIYENCELLYQLSFPRDNYQDYALVSSCSYDKAIKTKNITLCSRAENRKTECEGIVSHLSGTE